jgi:hypothetical protein
MPGANLGDRQMAKQPIGPDQNQPQITSFWEPRKSHIQFDTEGPSLNVKSSILTELTRSGTDALYAHVTKID